MFGSKLAQAALALSSMVSAKMIEMKEGELPSDYLNNHQFTLVAFYDSSPESQEILKVVEEGYLFVSEKIGNESWHERDIQWLKADIEKYPSLAFDKHGPTQLIYANDVKLSQKIDWALGDDGNFNAEVEHFSLVVRELTGEFIHFIECDQIQAETRYFYDEIVFFGDEADLDVGAFADNIEFLSMLDRYSFAEQRVQFFYNDDPECKKEHELDQDKKWIVSFNGHNSVPVAWSFEEDTPIDIEQLVYFVTTSIVKGTPKWGQRAHSAIFDMMQNGFIYMMPDLPAPEELAADWKIQLMSRITEIIQEQDTSFVPIVSLFERQSAYVPSLAEMMQVQKEDLPAFYVMHPVTDQLIKYPEPLEDVLKFSPELMLTWARAIVLSFELEKYANDIKEAKTREDIPDDKREEVVKIFAKYLSDAKTEKDIMTARLEEIKEELKAENLFAQALEQHFDVAMDHMERYHEAHMEL